jgi:hypothetical protein
MNPGEAVKMDSEYRNFLAELGGGAPPSDSGPSRGGGGGFGRPRPGDDLPDACKLYVGNLSQVSTAGTACTAGMALQVTAAGTLGWL